MDAVLTNLPRSLSLYEAALEGLARVDTELYRRDSSMPSIHSAGVRYRREVGEPWRHVADVIRERWGDCEDLAAARVGYLRGRDIDSRAKVIVRRTGPRMSHAMVMRGSGHIEDPSRDLGMGKEEAVMMNGKPRDWEMIGADPAQSAEISWTIEKTPEGGWRGTIRVPLELGRMLLVSRTDPKPVVAKQKAASAASKILDNPVVSSLVPPQARFALNLARSQKARKIAKKVLGIFT